MEMRQWLNVEKKKKKRENKIGWWGEATNVHNARRRRRTLNVRTNYRKNLWYGIAWWMNQSVQKIEAQKAGCLRMTRRQYADKAFNKVNSNYKFSFTPFRDVFQRRSEPIKRSLQRIDERKKRFDSNLLCFALKFSTLSFSPENSHPWQKSLLRHIFLQYFL